jgi:hypothetical protein
LLETIKEINNIQDKLNKIHSFEADAVEQFGSCFGKNKKSTFMSITGGRPS